MSKEILDLRGDGCRATYKSRSAGQGTFRIIVAYTSYPLASSFEILRALVQNVPLPITCKIRIFENLDQTLDLVRMIEKTGVKAIAVHCRTRAERPKDTPHWEVLASIVKAVNVPIIANGDVFDTEDLDKLWQIAGINSFMVARGAQANASVFRPLSHWMQSRFGSTIPPMLSSTSSSPTANPSGNPSSESQTKPFPLATPLRTVMRDYLRFALDYDMPYQNAKYTLVQMLPTKSEMKKMDIQNLKRRATEDGDDIDDAESLVGVEDEDPDLKPWTMDDNVRFSRAKSMKELAELLGLVEYHDQVVKARNEKAAKLQREDLMLKNSNGEYDSEFPYVPDAPYIPPKKKRHLDPSADQDLAAVAPAAGVAPTKIETPLQPPQALNAGITVTQEVP
ncbi:tRNA-dihydrouridine(20) synthase [NAD(P)+]-like [Quaeritorhiza haematococci]|nr:tRNA-dihydrouridine(20) synthase [NAD(P)+]-like [Quaeritorhiza haematococci]